MEGILSFNFFLEVIFKLLLPKGIICFDTMKAELNSGYIMPPPQKKRGIRQVWDFLFT